LQNLLRYEVEETKSPEAKLTQQVNRPLLGTYIILLKEGITGAKFNQIKHRFSNSKGCIFILLFPSFWHHRTSLEEKK